MRHPSRRARASLGIALTLGLALVARGETALAGGGRLEVYAAVIAAGELRDLVAEGYDVSAARARGDEIVVDLVLSSRERARLAARGVATSPRRDAAGRTTSERAALQQREPYKVWRSFDSPGGIRDELRALAASHPDLVKIEVLGTSIQDRDIIALKVTANAGTVTDGSRPAALFAATQHAREWIGLEVTRRLLHHVVDRYATDANIRELLDTTELWFVPVLNPDGYQHTHDVERLWRKNLRDNDADGAITDVDGVDLNRNLAGHWGYDNSGSSPSPASDAYRGPSPASEPETRALQGLLERVDISLFLNYHSVAELLLYPIGWQEQTRTVDDAIFTALVGTPDRPAVEGFLPIISAGLYATNGETCDYAYQVGTLCITPELSDQGTGDGFVFRDDESLIAKEFERNLPFALDVARSARNPAEPVSHLGNTTEPWYIQPFAESFGDPQAVEVVARRSIESVRLVYRINSAPPVRIGVSEAAPGERYGVPGRFYARYRGEVHGARPGDVVEAWFEGVGEQSESFTYRVVSDTGAPVLVLAAEDYSGASPAYRRTDAPSYVQAYLDALHANGVPADVYDVDARGRRAPSLLGVLSHYRAVIWYTGDDIVTRTRGMQPGTASRLANETMLALRDFVNAGGKLLYSGNYAALQLLSGSYVYDPGEDRPCRQASAGVACDALLPDFANYYLGLDTFTRSSDAALEPDNLAGAGAGWWSGSVASSDVTVTREIDLAGLPGDVRLSFDAAWNLQTDTDYGYVEVSEDGIDWRAVPDIDGVLTDADPNGLNLGWALTGSGARELRFDLSHLAGRPFQLRLRCVTDRRTTYSGWFVDNLALVVEDVAIYASDLEPGFEGWDNHGWLLVPEVPPSDVHAHPLVGLAPPLTGLRWELAPSSGRSNHEMSYTPISRTLPPAEFPQFASAGAAWADAPATRPRTGESAIYSNGAVYSFQRLTRIVDLAGAAGGELSFWISHAIRSPYDAVFVEARTDGADDWTTLPETSGHTAPATSLSCATASWFDRFPRLAHYMTVSGEGIDRTCAAVGSTGVWNAASGDSGGWQHWSFDLAPYAGRRAELSIAVITSRQVSRGVLIDDVALSTGDATSFEDGWDGWRVEGAPPGSRVTNSAELVRAGLRDMPDATVIVTEDTITFGFGLERIATAESRREVLQRVLEYFGIETPGPEPPRPVLHVPYAACSRP